MKYPVQLTPHFDVVIALHQCRVPHAPSIVTYANTLGAFNIAEVNSRYGCGRVGSHDRPPLLAYAC